MPNEIQKTLAKIVRLRAHEVALFEQLRGLRRQATFVCICGKRHRIGNCIAVQTHWHHIDGYDNDWMEGDIHIVCPDTKQENRIYFPHATKENRRDTQFRHAFSELFKAMASRSDPDEHTSMAKHPMHNNTYFDDHPEEFGLE